MTSIINGRLQTPQGAPSTLIFDLPAIMINSTKLENRIQPYGQSHFSQSGQNIKFVIPKTDRAFINTRKMYITGNVVLDGFTPLEVAGTDLMYVLGTYYSIFSRQVISSNGKVLETIEKPAELVNMLLNMTLDSAEKRFMPNNFANNDIANGEMDATFNICQPINTAVAGKTTLPGSGKSYTFALPIVGLLNTTKFIPLINGDISIELTINDIRNWLIGSTTVANTAITTSQIAFIISNLELVIDQLMLTPESYAQVMTGYPEKLYIKTQSYDFGTGQPFTQKSGAQDIPVNIKRSSLKQVLFYFNQTGLIDRDFGGINPNGSDICFITNGISYPQRPLRLNNPSECYNQVQKAFGSIYSGTHGGSAGKMEFCIRSTTTGSNLFYPALTNATHLQTSL